MQEKHNYKPWEDAIADAGGNPQQSATEFKAQGFERFNDKLWMKQRDSFDAKKFLISALVGLPPKSEVE